MPTSPPATPTRIHAILHNEPGAADEFDKFLSGLRANLNDSITADDAMSMLSQHLITLPIFKALFGTDSFAANNPVSQAMQGMVDILDQHNLDTETENLDKFYDSVRRRVEGIPQHDADARQRIITDLYGRFFAIAFPKVAEALGIVYTPIEIVDFILRATETALNEHFDGVSLTDPGVHILDPFTGTGTFITRLLQTEIIRPHDLARKYTEEIHANEILPPRLLHRRCQHRIHLPTADRTAHHRRVPSTIPRHRAHRYIRARRT